MSRIKTHEGEQNKDSVSEQRKSPKGEQVKGRGILRKRKPVVDRVLQINREIPMLTGYESKEGGGTGNIDLGKVDLSRPEEFAERMITTLKEHGAFHMLVGEEHPEHHSMVRRTKLDEIVRRHDARETPDMC